jgi:hypothetical protein
MKVNDGRGSVKMEGREIDFFEQLRVGQLLKSFQSWNL